MQTRPRNAPHIIRSSLLRYIRTEFAHGKDWHHPITGEVFTSQDIRRALEYYKGLNPENYRALWALWHTGKSRTWIAERFRYSGSSLRRRWDRSVDSLLVFLQYPDLRPEDLRELLS